MAAAQSAYPTLALVAKMTFADQETKSMVQPARI
jgi:hypothetical protein